MSDRSKTINRRSFVQLGAGAGIASGAAIASLAADAEEKKTGEMAYRPLGKTGLKVSEVSFGTYGFSNSALLEQALDKGINLICTCAIYQNGVAEESIGRVMKKRRKDAVLFTGWVCREGTTKEKLIASLDQSLRRLQTDYIDIIKSHFVNQPSELDNDAQYEAFEEAKKAGKVRFLGVSCHGGNEVEILAKALEKNVIDVFQFKYNFMENKPQAAVLTQAAKSGVGIVAFKIDAGKRQGEIKDLEKKGLTLHQAAVRWALSNHDVSSVCVTISNFNNINELQEAVSKKLSRVDTDILERYAKEVDRSYCRYCSACETHCPYGVAIADIMRYSMYFKYYKMEKEAMRLYAELTHANPVADCLNCRGNCERGCPHGRAVREGLLEAGRLLA